MMDIFAYARENNADYYDWRTGNIYHVQDYNRSKQLGLPTEGIMVSNGGRFMGIVREPIE